MSELALIMIKPDAFVRQLDTKIIHLVKGAELKVIATKLVQLDEKMIRTYQPILNEPSQFGEKWKSEAIRALTSKPVKILIVEGEEALQKADSLKRKLRSVYCPGLDYKSRVIFNLIHTADCQSELINNINVLFPEALNLLCTAISL